MHQEVDVVEIGGQAHHKELEQFLQNHRSATI